MNRILRKFAFTFILTIVLMLNSCIRCENESYYDDILLTDEQKNLFPYQEGDTLRFSTYRDTIELYCQSIEKKSIIVLTGAAECQQYHDLLEKWAMNISNEKFQFTFNLVAVNRDNDCDIHIEFDKMTSRLNTENGSCFNSNPEDPILLDSILLNGIYYKNVFSQEDISFMYNNNHGVLKFRNDTSIYEIIK